MNSITDYGGSVIGFDQHEGPLKIHLRAARAFLGVPKIQLKMQSYQKLIGFYQNTEQESE